MSDIGYIKLFRTLRHCWVWNGEKFSKGQAWIDLLLSANHQDEKVPLGSQLFDVKRGSFITSKMKLADRWGWSNTKVDSFLKMLEQDGMVTVKSDTKRTFVTIENWELYQSVDSEKTKQINNKYETKTEQEHNKDETKTKQKHTVNNEKNDKECNKNDKEIKHIYGEYKKVRLTDKEFERLCNDYGQEITLKAIKKLDEYKEMKGTTYKSDNLAIKNWVIDSLKNNNTSNNLNNYSNDKQAQKLNIVFNGGLTQ